MTYISPILSSTLNKKNNTNKASENHYNKIYEELTRHANDVKPNAPKARLIKGGPVHAVQNTIKDTKNFFKAVKDGKLSDNNLGRINDLGMKFGALLIASFLASKAKTKTEAVMQFIGGATFFASMSLWPKLFINLPARIVHGFDIGQRYVSAQGDEKDFFLDNQFVPWDAQPKEELRKIGKRTGIDYDSPNGEEKIKEKMRKTALQNRTLGMATAGFATPLMTAMVGNAVEPKVRDIIIERVYKKAKDIITPKKFYEQDGGGSIREIGKSGLEDYLSGAKADVRNVDGIENLFKEYSDKNLDKNFYEKLCNMLQVNTPVDFVKERNGELAERTYQMFKDLDDYAPIESFRADNLADVIRSIQEQTAVVDEQSLKDALKKLNINVDIADYIDSANKAVSSKTVTVDVDGIVNDFANSADKTIGGLKKILKTHGLDGVQIGTVEKGIRMDNAPFFEVIKKYNESVLPEIRGRFKSYMDLFNSVMGSKTESKTTKEYLMELDKLMKRFNFSYDDLKEMTNSGVESSEAKLRLVKYFEKFADKTKSLTLEEYKKELGNFLSIPLDKDLLDTMEHLVDPKNIQSITENAKSTGDNAFFKLLNTAFIGENGNRKSGLIGALDRFKQEKILSLDAIKAKALICSNFERRVESLDFKRALEETGLILSEAKKAGMTPEEIALNSSIPYEDWIKYARSVIYDGSIAKDACNANIGDKTLYETLKGIIYNPKAFEVEDVILNGAKEGREYTNFDIKGVVERLKNLNQSVKEGKNDYSRSLSFSKAVSERATAIFNNKSWKRIFVPMTVALIAVTLLAQPFFGNIKKEFPEENKNGGTK